MADARDLSDFPGIDVNVAMGDLVSLARSQGKAFRRR